ncbi:19176_t:CDS:10 [Funneliformis geosporum]|nr:19176_t:CDS:10 [Funneliformis geosporum]
MAESFNDFLAGYISGVAGLLVGSPLDVLKVRLQTQQRTAPTSSEGLPTSSIRTLIEMKKNEGMKSLLKGVESPIIGLALLNSILFASYGGIIRAFEKYDGKSPFVPTLSQVYFAGFGAGIACFLASTPTELVKCRTQAVVNSSTWNVFKSIFFTKGIRGFYQGGLITIIRDAPGYGVYFWAYEGLKRVLGVTMDNSGENVTKLLFAGGMAGMISWGSIYPLDVIKSRLQTQIKRPSSSINLSSITMLTQYPEELAPLVSERRPYYNGIIDCTIKSYRAEGISVFFRGIMPTLIRALPVNAVTFYIYEAMIKWLNVFDVVLKYIYTGKIALDQQDGKEILRILMAADELILHDLFGFIQQHLIEYKAEWMQENFDLVRRTVFQNDRLKKLQEYCVDRIWDGEDLKNIMFSRVQEPSRAVLCSQAIGPCFGSGDLVMGGTHANFNLELGCSCKRQSYERHLITNHDRFSVDEYEIFKVIPKLNARTNQSYNLNTRASGRFSLLLSQNNDFPPHSPISHNSHTIHNSHPLYNSHNPQNTHAPHNHSHTP